MALIGFLFLVANICFKYKYEQFFDGGIMLLNSLYSFYVYRRPAFAGRQVSQMIADKRYF